MKPCTTDGATTGNNEYGTAVTDTDYFAFPKATSKRVQFKTRLPIGWDLGTVTAQFDWSSATGSTIGDTCEWGIKAVALRNGDAMNTALGTPQVISDTLLVSDGAQNQATASTPALTIGGTPAARALCVFEVYRNVAGTDDMTEDAWLFGVEITFANA